MSHGAFTLADVDQSTPPPPAGKFTAADLDAPSPPTPSAFQRLGDSALSGAGVVSNEEGKNFFLHPVDTLKAMANLQGELGERAKKELENKDYVRGLTHGVEWLLPGLGPTLARAGDQLESGDTAGGIGTTLGAAANLLAGAKAAAIPDAAEGVVTSVAAKAATGARATAGAVDNVINHPLTQAIAKTIDAASFDRAGKLWNAWKNLPEEIRARGPQFTDPGAPLPEKPPQQLLQARGLAQGGMHTPEPSDALGKLPATGAAAEPGPIYPGAPLPPKPPAEVFQAKPLAEVGQPTPKPQSAALGDLPAPAIHQATQELGPQATVAELTDRANEIASGNSVPRTYSGESALRQVLTGQDNANLLKIAKSRGINVAQETQLKAGVADNRIINKIVNDFAPEELDEIRDQYLENSRFRHAFGDIGPEAWKTMSLQSYFPDLRIPATKLARMAKAVTAASPSAAPVAALSADDLTGILQQSLAAAKARQ